MREAGALVCFFVCTATYGGPLEGSVLAKRAPAPPIPFSLQRNQGELPPDVKYFARGPAYTLELANREIRLLPVDGSRELVLSFPSSPSAPASRTARIEPLDRFSFHVNTIRGADPARWMLNAEAWSRVRYRQIEPGVDLVIHPAKAAREWEYDFEIAPGADPSGVAFDVRGAASMAVNADGDLAARTRDGNTILWHRPVSYQTSYPGGKTREIATRFDVAGTRVRFKVGNWNRREPLVIDPSFTFSTYFGGSGNDIARGIGVDSSGNVYICGSTTSGNLPVTKASYQTSMHGGLTFGDGFLAKFNASGGLAWVTYFGGSADDMAMALALDTSGNVYLTGFTTSGDFPKLNAFQATFAGGGGNSWWGEGCDAFVAKFTSAGALIYSTYLGGTMDDDGLAIAVDTAGNAYVAGYTMSSNFPLANGYQTAFAGSENVFINANGYVGYNLGDAFVAKLGPTGQLIISTYLGGRQDEAADAITLDSAGNVWIGGATNSVAFPVVNGLPGGYQGESPGSLQPVANLGDGFVSRLNSGLTELQYSTYLGGSGDDAVTALAVDASGSAYAAGLTVSSNFPVTKGSVQTAYAGPTTLTPGAGAVTGDAFIAKFNPSGSALTYCTYLGGSDNDFASGLAVDAAGNAYLTGSTSSGNFPMGGTPIQRTYGGRTNSGQMGDAFMAEIDPTGEKLLYSSYLGGNSQDIALGLALSGGTVYVAGVTSSTNFPVQSPYQGSLSTQDLGYNAFVSAVEGLSSGPVLNAVTNIASYATGSVAPGEVVALFGSAMGPSSIVTAQLDPATGLVSSNLAGTQVFFDGVAAPIVYTEAQQVAAVAPYELAGKSSTVVAVNYNGVPSGSLTIPVVAAQPGLFSSDSSGHGQGAIYNQTGTANSASNPAAQESVVTLFGTGEGVTSPALNDGQLVTNVSPPQNPAGAVTVTFDNLAATEVDYKGPIPDLVAGFWQINVRLPAGLGTGTHQVTVSVGGAQSQSNFTISVQ